MDIQEKMFLVAKKTYYWTIASTIILAVIAVIFGYAQLPAKSNITIDSYLGSNRSASEAQAFCNLFNCILNYNDSSYKKLSFDSGINYYEYNLGITDEGKSTADIGIILKCNFDIVGGNIKPLSKGVNANLEFNGNILPSIISVDKITIKDLVVISLFSTNPPDSKKYCHVIYSSEDKSKQEKDLYFLK